MKLQAGSRRLRGTAACCKLLLLAQRAARSLCSQRQPAANANVAIAATKLIAAGVSGSSIGVGFVLAAVALVLVGQSRKLLVGERASEDVLQAVHDADDDGKIEFAECPLRMQLGPNEVLLGVTARFAPHLSANDVAMAIQRFEDRLRKARPDVKYICVEPISPTGISPNRL